MTTTDMQNAPPALRLIGLAKRYGAVTAVDGLDLTVPVGQVVALLGPNGAGKSTTIDLLLGLSSPDRGRISLFGADPARAVADGRVGALLQSGGLLPDLTVIETVQLIVGLQPARPARRPHGQTATREVDDLMARADLTEIAGRRVGVLSGGQQQRVRFAMALAGDPDLLVLDEPTTGMDVETRRAFWATLRSEAGRGRTVLFATHYLDEADAFADRIVLLRAGRMIADGSPASIKSVVSGRIVRATLPDADPAALAALPGVRSVELRGDSVLLGCDDSDAALRRLLTTTGARDVEVAAHNLEDAFVALTHPSMPDHRIAQGNRTAQGHQTSQGRGTTQGRETTVGRRTAQAHEADRSYQEAPR